MKLKRTAFRLTSTWRKFRQPNREWKLNWACSELWNSRPSCQSKIAPPAKAGTQYAPRAMAGAWGPTLPVWYPVSEMHQAWLGFKKENSFFEISIQMKSHIVEFSLQMNVSLILTRWSRRWTLVSKVAGFNLTGSRNLKIPWKVYLLHHQHERANSCLALKFQNEISLVKPSTDFLELERSNKNYFDLIDPRNE